MLLHHLTLPALITSSVYKGHMWSWLLSALSGMSDISALVVLRIAELMALDDEDFVNAHHPDQTSPMVQAARGGHAYAVLSMYACGGCPVEQGSDWIVFLRAATSTFSPRMAHVVHLIFRNMPSIIPVSDLN